MFIIILWLLLHAKHNYTKGGGKQERGGGETEREVSSPLYTSAGLSNDIIII